MSRGDEAAAAAQRAVADARAQLFSGRGRGASEPEIAVHTRDRLTLGDRDTVDERAATHRQTGRARGDAAALSDQIALTRQQLAATVSALATRLDPRQVATRELTAQVRRTRLAAARFVEDPPPGSVPAVGAVAALAAWLLCRRVARRQRR